MENRVTGKYQKRAKGKETKNSDIIHEVQQPLGAMSMLAELALKDMDNPATDERDKTIRATLKEIVQQGRLGAEIIAEIKETNGSGLSFKPVEINPLINRALCNAAYDDKATGISFQRDLKTDLPTVEGDQNALYQLFTNLFKNAVEAMQHNTRKVLAVTSRKDKYGVKITIIDTGCGMDNQLKNEIAGSHYHSTGNGRMGSGLTLCREIIYNHKGSISVQSKVNTGTRLEVTLPTSIASSL